MVEKPQALLGAGERNIFLLRATRDGRSLAPSHRGISRPLQPFFQQRFLGIRKLRPRQSDVVSNGHDRSFADNSASSTRRSTSASDNSPISRTSASSITVASSAIVAASKNRRSDSSMRKASRTRESTCVSNKECPPSSKKLS